MSVEKDQYIYIKVCKEKNIWHPKVNKTFDIQNSKAIAHQIQDTLHTKIHCLNVWKQFIENNTSLVVAF